jgi:hypothetical protein
MQFNCLLKHSVKNIVITHYLIYTSIYKVMGRYNQKISVTPTEEFLLLEIFRFFRDSIPGPDISHFPRKKTRKNRFFPGAQVHVRKSQFFHLGKFASLYRTRSLGHDPSLTRVMSKSRTSTVQVQDLQLTFSRDKFNDHVSVRKEILCRKDI